MDAFITPLIRSIILPNTPGHIAIVRILQQSLKPKRIRATTPRIYFKSIRV